MSVLAFRRPLTAALTTASLVAGAAVVGLTVGATAAQAAAGAPFNCTVTPFVFQSHATGAQGKSTGLFVQQFTDTGSGFSPQELGGNGEDPTGYKYNAMGFDTVDNYLYAIGTNPSSAGPELLLIDNTGTITPIGQAMSGGAPVSSDTGAFDNAGNYYIGGTGGLYEATSAAIQAARANANPNADIPFTAIAVTGAGGDSFSDFSWSKGDPNGTGTGYLWGADGDGTLVRINPTTGVAQVFPGVVKPINSTLMGAYGAAWTFGNGNLGFDSNAGDTATGLGVQEVSLANPDAPSLLRQVSGPVSAQNDGAACAGPADLAITKTINGQTTTAAAPASVAPGAAFTWVITVKDNGTADSSEQLVTDTVPAGVTITGFTDPGAVSCTQPTAGQTFTCSYGTLDVGDTEAITITGTAPANVGTEFDNTATVSGDEVDPTLTNNTATAYAKTPSPSFTFSKSATVVPAGDQQGARAGDTIDYAFTATNTSPVTQTGLTITDSRVAGISCPTTTLAPAGQAGATVVCTASYTVTQADVDAGTIVNNATATTIAPGGGTVGPIPASATVPAVGAASTLVLAKTAVDTRTGSTTGAETGDTIDYGFAVTNGSAQNPSTVSLSAVTVTDPMFPGGISCSLAGQPGGLLAPGATVTCTGTTHTVSQADFDAGAIVNTATATATPVRGPAPAPSTSTATVTMATPVNTVTLTKTGTDDQTGTATGANVGDTLSYGFTITNVANPASSSLTAATITDTLLPAGAISCAPIPAGGIAPGGSLQCTATSAYTVTQADVDAGSIMNTASVTASFARGPQAQASASATVAAAAPESAIILTKTALDTRTGTTTGAETGDTIDYGFAVTNGDTQDPSNVSLSAVTVTDPMFPGAISCDLSGQPGGLLAPGATVTCTGTTHTVTQADFDAGSIVNTATANGTPVRGTAPAPSTSTATVTMAPAVSAIVLTKTAVDTATGTTSGALTGDTVDYGFVVANGDAQNPSNVSLSAVTVTDPMFPGAISCDLSGQPNGLLAPGATVTCTGTTHTVSQADFDAGSIVNTATATGTPVRGAAPAPSTSTATVTMATPDNTVALTKTGTDDQTGTATGANVGDTLSYGFTITNVPNPASSSLTAATITDTLLPAGAISCAPIPAGGIAPGGTLQCTATFAYTVTQADFDAGAVNNTATVTATYARGPQAQAPASATVAAAPAAPAIGLTKTAVDTRTGTAADALAGDEIDYSFVATNTGNVSLSTVTIADADPDVGPVTCAALPDDGGTALAPGDSVACTADTPHTVTQAEFDAQQPLVNTATASAVPLRGTPDPVVSGVATATVTLAAPVLGLTNTKVGTVTPAADQNAVAVGDTIQYSYTITNTGNVTMYDVGVDDAHPGLGPITCPDTSQQTVGSQPGDGLAPGATLTCSTGVDGYTVTQADVDAGFVYNEATPTGTPPPAVTGGPFSGTPGESTIQAEPAAPAISLVKTATVTPASDQDAALTGDTIGYSFLVTNTGNITVSDVAIDDEDLDVGPITCPAVPAPGIAPGGSTTCTADTPHTVTQAEFDAQQPLVNTAFATATAARGPAAVQQLGLRRPAALRPHAAPAAPTAVQVTSNTSTATVPLGAPIVSMTIVKTPTVVPAKDQKAYRVGDKIDYSFLVTNTGNVTMSDVGVDDATLGTVTCPSIPAPGLAPGTSVTCTGDEPHVVTQADVDAGSLSNTATAHGTPPPAVTGGSYTSPPATVTVPAVKADPELTLVKKAVVDPAADQHALHAGDSIDYTFLVTNTGNVTLTKIGVNDPTGGSVTCPEATLAPGHSETCHADHSRVVTQSDYLAGTALTNTATASGTPPQGLPVRVSDPSTVTLVMAAQAIATGALPFTGLPALALLQAGQWLLADGLLLLIVARRRRRPTPR